MQTRAQPLNEKLFRRFDESTSRPVDGMAEGLAAQSREMIFDNLVVV